jgi:HD-like signal output (HDOD) protein
VSQLIGSDVALSASLLKLANSPFYGLSVKAASVQQGLTLLGLGPVTQIVTGLLLRQAFPIAAGPAIERYWKASMATAMTAAMLARETRCADSAIAYTYALFMNCGMPLMLQRFPVYADLIDGSALEGGAPIQEIEKERYGTTHALIGAHLARSWHLSEPVCRAILHHHDVTYLEDLRTSVGAEAGTLIALGMAAENLHCAWAGEPSHEWAHAGDWARSLLRLDAGAEGELQERVERLLDQL